MGNPVESHAGTTSSDDGGSTPIPAAAAAIPTTTAAIPTTTATTICASPTATIHAAATGTAADAVRHEQRYPKAPRGLRPAWIRSARLRRDANGRSWRQEDEKDEGRQAQEEVSSTCPFCMQLFILLKMSFEFSMFSVVV